MNDFSSAHQTAGLADPTEAAAGADARKAAFEANKRPCGPG